MADEITGYKHIDGTAKLFLRYLRAADQGKIRGELKWPTPQKLVHPKWESLGKMNHGGRAQHEQGASRQLPTAAANCR
jgi:hypothetical protein